MLWNEILVALAGSALGAIATIVTGLKRSNRDPKGDWWERFTWAAKAVESTNPGVRAAALEILKGLAVDTDAALADRKAADALLHENIKSGETSDSQDDNTQIKV